VPFKSNGDVDAEALKTVATEIRGTIGERYGGTKGVTTENSGDSGDGSYWSQFHQNLKREREAERPSGPTASERLRGVRSAYDPVADGRARGKAEKARNDDRNDPNGLAFR
jgi:hypothetical protein